MRLSLALDLWADKHGGYFLYDELVKRAEKEAQRVVDVELPGLELDATGLCIECGRLPDEHSPRCSRRPL